MIASGKVTVTIGQTYPLTDAAQAHRDIEARVAMEKYEVSRAAKRLRESGLIERKENPEDRRLVVLSLTPKGREMMAELLPLAKAHQARLEARLGEAFAELEAGLEALLNETK